MERRGGGGGGGESGGIRVMGIEEGRCGGKWN